jgi:hypothetical protein
MRGTLKSEDKITIKDLMNLNFIQNGEVKRRKKNNP